jgi:hypothetical protein
MPQPKNPNFQALWIRLLSLAQEMGDNRLKATLENHREKPEYICRKFGVVTESDVLRIRNDLTSKSRFSRKSGSD